MLTQLITCKNIREITVSFLQRCSFILWSSVFLCLHKSSSVKPLLVHCRPCLLSRSHRILRDIEALPSRFVHELLYCRCFLGGDCCRRWRHRFSVFNFSIRNPLIRWTSLGATIKDVDASSIFIWESSLDSCIQESDSSLSRNHGVSSIAGE